MIHYNIHSNSSSVFFFRGGCNSNCGLVWRKGTIAYSITWYIYIYYIYIYIYVYIYIYTHIHLVFHIKNQVLDLLGGSLSFFFGFFSRVSMGCNSSYDLPRCHGFHHPDSEVGGEHCGDRRDGFRGDDWWTGWKSGWWLMMMVAL